MITVDDNVDVKKVLMNLSCL